MCNLRGGCNKKLGLFSLFLLFLSLFLPSYQLLFHLSFLSLKIFFFHSFSLSLFLSPLSSHCCSSFPLSSSLMIAKLCLPLSLSSLNYTFLRDSIFPSLSLSSTTTFPFFFIKPNLLLKLTPKLIFHHPLSLFLPLVIVLSTFSFTLSPFLRHS